MWFRLLLGYELDGHVTGALADPRGASERARAVTLQRRTFVHVRLADSQLVGDQLVVFLRVGDRGLQQLQHVARGGARRVHQDRARLVHALAADVVDHEPRLARRASHVLRSRADRHVAARGAAARGRSAARATGCGGAAAATARAALLVLGLRLALGLGLLGLDLLLGVLLLDLLRGLLGLGDGRLRLGLGGGLVLLRAPPARLGLLLGGLGLRRLGLLRGRLLRGGLAARPLGLLLALCPLALCPLVVVLSHQRIRARSPPAWPRNSRVGANSPSLWPTIDSDTNTGTCLRPSCTAIVCPTISGKMVEVRDQVLIICFCPLEFIASMRVIRRSSTHGPFLELRDI